MTNNPVTLQQACDEFLVYLETIRGLSDNTVTAYREDYSHLMNTLGAQTPMNSIKSEDLRLCVGILSKNNYKATSVNRFISATRSLFAYSKKFQYIQTNVAEEIKTLRIAKKLPRYMTRGEIDELCAMPENVGLLWPARDKAIFEMLYSSGCRVSELVSLRMDSFTEGFASAKVMGKGSKERYVFFEKDSRDALELYLKERNEKLGERAAGEKMLFLNQALTPLTTDGVRYILQRYSGVDGTNHPVNPHAFRHTFATQMLSEGADIRMVQEMLGHSTISTTQRYTHVTAAQLKEAYAQAFPHSGKKD